MRIVSLVPSITELLYDLGLQKETVGITRFCVHPAHWFRSKPRVGGTKNVHIDTVKALRPTLVIASKEENIKEQVEALATFSEVLLTDVGNFEEALQMIHTIGMITGKINQAQILTSRILQHFNDWGQQELHSAAYIIWKDPLMTVGGDSFIHSMMAKAGFGNIAGEQLRYPEITIERLQEIRPQYILLSTEPYPFKDLHVTTLQERLPFSKVVLADGEMFSWYGSRMLYAAGYFEQLRNTLKVK